MIIEYREKQYETIYYPFFRISKSDSYHIYGLRYPSGRIERVFVLDGMNPFPELKTYLKFLVAEYIMEDDNALTPYAKKLKEDINELFGKRLHC